MKIHIAQVYLEPGARYPFSHHFQLAMGEALSMRVEPSASFINAYGPDYEVMVRISADSTIASSVTKGPTVFKKDKDVEYTVFLPYDRTRRMERSLYREVALSIIDSVVAVLDGLGIDTRRIVVDRDVIVDEVLGDPRMTKVPWMT